MKDPEAILAARSEINANLDALEQFSFDAELSAFDLERFSSLLCAFHTGNKTRVRYATKVQIDRLKQAVPRLLSEHIPRLSSEYLGDPEVGSLVDRDWPIFLQSVEKLHRARDEQSASGRGVYGRETVAKVAAERDAALAERDALRAQLGAKREEDTEDTEEEKKEAAA